MRLGQTKLASGFLLPVFLIRHRAMTKGEKPYGRLDEGIKRSATSRPSNDPSTFHPFTVSENEPVALSEELILNQSGHHNSAESNTMEKSSGKQRFSFMSKSPGT